MAAKGAKTSRASAKSTIFSSSTGGRGGSSSTAGATSALEGGLLRPVLLSRFVRLTSKNPLPLLCILYGTYFVASGVSHLANLDLPLEELRSFVKLVSLTVAILFYTRTRKGKTEGEEEEAAQGKGKQKADALAGKSSEDPSASGARQIGAGAVVEVVDEVEGPSGDLQSVELIKNGGKTTDNEAHVDGAGRGDTVVRKRAIPEGAQTSAADQDDSDSSQPAAGAGGGTESEAGGSRSSSSCKNKAPKNKK